MKFYLLEDAFQKTFHKEIKGKKIYIVDGEFIRTHLDIEFTNFGTHYHFPDLIPKGEIWLDKEYDPGEINYFITSAITEYDKMAAGESYEDAHDTAEKVETNQRGKTMLRKDNCRIKLWKKLAKANLKIFIVDGEAVRDQYDIDFTEGGNSGRYDFIPKSEIWIDDDIAPKERKYVLAHELFEKGAMEKRGLSYEEAHKQASKYEKQLRKKNKRSVI